jgi:hypothetical protein
VLALGAAATSTVRVAHHVSVVPGFLCIRFIHPWVRKLRLSRVPAACSIPDWNIAPFSAAYSEQIKE